MMPVTAALTARDRTIGRRGKLISVNDQIQEVQRGIAVYDYPLTIFIIGAA